MAALSFIAVFHHLNECWTFLHLCKLPRNRFFFSLPLNWNWTTRMLRQENEHINKTNESHLPLSMFWLHFSQFPFFVSNFYLHLSTIPKCNWLEITSFFTSKHHSKSNLLNIATFSWYDLRAIWFHPEIISFALFLELMNSIRISSKKMKIRIKFSYTSHK